MQEIICKDLQLSLEGNGGGIELSIFTNFLKAHPELAPELLSAAFHFLERGTGTYEGNRWT